MDAGCWNVECKCFARVYLFEMSQARDFSEIICSTVLDLRSIHDSNNQIQKYRNGKKREME